ncbi:MAG: hypothetical protein DWQ34_00265 [Planctomycetota bacterium]|nr:MAG: hypothetical protein DWQ34_00265 [Planctomycetota bacterium]REK23627.1 MAG: hypothetical protein DWQ41_16460 [Planctomycetota bacterium]REK31146.1 MAG: hypothetical protein DWQ45_20070 [Planctomycetota bacterium]
MDFLAHPVGRRILFTALYFSEGAPVGFIWYALPARMRSRGVDVEDVTSFTALLVLPWTLKFLWAPVVDVCQSRFWTLKHWILAAQAVMVLTLLPLAWLDLGSQRDVILRWLLLHAFAAATQDAAIDALCIRVTDSNERGRLNGWMQAGTLLGRALLGGGALIVFDRLGQAGVVATLACTTAVSAVFVWSARLPRDLQPTEHRQARRFTIALADAMRLPWTWLGLAFALIGGAGFEALGAVTGPLLIDSGFSEDAVGILQAVPLPAGMVAGSLAGGWLADRYGHVRIVAISLVLVALNVTAVAAGWEFAGRIGHFPLVALLCTNALGVGLLTASSFALLMDLTWPSTAATQFSAFMGAINACEAWAAFAVGKLIAAAGYGGSLAAMAAASLAALPILALIHRTTATRRSLIPSSSESD